MDTTTQHDEQDTGQSFARVVREVARHLPGWTTPAQPNERGGSYSQSASLHGPQGMEILLLTYQGDEKWSACGRYPRSRPRESLEIHQSWTRPAKALAQDLQRRLIGPYALSYARHRAIDAEHDAQDGAAQAFMQRAAQTLPGMIARDRRPGWHGEQARPEPEAHYSGNQLDSLSATLTPGHYGASLNLGGLTQTQALAVLSVLAEHLTGQPTHQAP